MKKKSKVMLLPVNQNISNIGMFEDTNNLVYNNPNNSDIPRGRMQHLYLLSEKEEIKKGDWLFDTNLYEIYQAKTNSSTTIKYVYKIIATTDDLSITTKSNYAQFGINVEETKLGFLPQLPQSFIKKYITEYNNGNTITDVMIEYEDCGVADHNSVGLVEHRDTNGLGFYTGHRVKVNPKDNTIYIKSQKDSWNKEEVISLLKEFRNSLLPVGEKEIQFTKNWINENL